MWHIKHHSASFRRDRRRVLACEALETRWLLAITVDTLIDEADGSIVDGDVSLRDALAAAPAGETIDFNGALDGGTILLTMGELLVTKALTIDATALSNGLTIDASGNDPTPDEDNGDGSRVFNIDDGDFNAEPSVTVSGLTLTGGDTNESGGAIFSSGVSLSVRSSTISGNYSGEAGGGVFARTPGTDPVTVTNSTISGHSAVRGGGIYVLGYVTVTNSTISGNSTDRGGGIYVVRDVTVTNSTISGSGIRVVGNVSVTNSTVSGNSTGGGIYTYVGDVSVTNSTISGNSLGAGISTYYGNVTLTNSTISGNSWRGIETYHGDVTVTNSTISGNLGSGISADGDVTVTSTTISGNVGGVGASGDVTVVNSIVAGNTDNDAALDMHPGTGTLTVRYSLIGDNTSTGLAEAPVDMPDANGNLIGDPNGFGIIDPLLAPLADNGGPTQTHALLLGSPAIDMGDPTTLLLPPPFDQRGTPFVRLYGGRIDMGAYERQLVVDVLFDESDGDFSPGDLSLREAVAISNGVALSNVITFDASLDGGTILLTMGELAITERLTIDATALPAGLTIDASGSDPTPDEDNGDGIRILSIFDGNIAHESPVTIRGLTLTGGDVSGGGGAILAFEDLTVTSSTISGNSTRGGGGGVYGRTVTVINSTISGNSTQGSGGGVFGRTVTVINSTISGNSARLNSGGISGGTVTITNSTISGNSARGSGGGVSGRTVTIESSILAGNVDGGSTPDLLPGTGLLTARYSLIGDNTGTGLAEAPVGMPDANGNLIGGPMHGIIDPILVPLADNGGPTQTHALMAGSPAIDAGDPAAMAGIGDVPCFDQRGAPFGRVVGSRIDIGAHESRGSTVDIIAVATPTLVPVDEVTIQFNSEITGFDTGDLELSLNGGANLLTDNQTLITTDNRTYMLGGLADVTTGSGYYTLRLVSADSDIVDANGSPLEAGDTINWVMGRLVLGLTVDTLIDKSDGNIDDGDVSLRDALAAAAPGETIDFDASLDGGTILLTLGELPISRTLTIDGSALTDGLTIDASGNDPTPAEDKGDGSRLFNIDDRNGSRVLEVEIRGLTLTGGDVSGEGGAIFSHENVTVTDSTISENSARDNGGGFFGGTVTVTNSSISENSARGNGGGIIGGRVTVTNSTISGNSARGSGGGISGGTVTVTNTTISENSARGSGGGMSGGTVTVTNSTVSGNSAHKGGGISGGDITVTNSTISGNSAAWFGGGVFAFGAVTVSIENSIVAGNTDAGTAPDIRPHTGTLTVHYSLVGDNTGTGFAEAPVGMPDANGNLVGDLEGMGIIDPLLAPLADNGGPTQTHALLAGSPAINAGDPSFTPPPDFDQRGAPFDRVFGGRIDMGAYERRTGDMNLDGDIDYDDIVALVLGLTDLSAYEAVYGAPPHANGDTDGDADLDYDDISGFVDLLSSDLAASTSNRATEPFNMIGIAHERADVRVSRGSRREASSRNHLAKSTPLPPDHLRKKKTHAPRLRSASTTASRDRALRDVELGIIVDGRATGRVGASPLRSEQRTLLSSPGPIAVTRDRASHR